MYSIVRVCLFGIGLDKYLSQLEGLLNNLKKYQEQIKNKIVGFVVYVADAGMVDNPNKVRI